MRRTVLTFSLLTLFGLCLAGPYQDALRQTQGITNPKELVKVLKSGPSDPRIEELSKTVSDQKGLQQKYAVQTLRGYLETRAAAESLGSDPQALNDIKKIKKSLMYRDEEVASANWFGKAGDALWTMIRKFLDSLQRTNTKQPDMATMGILGVWAVYLMWGVLGCLVIGLAYIAIRHARWKKRLKRKTSALLEEDEPERTLDEWLERADMLERAGHYREAVRCLYLACLLRFDEARVARFDRGQTNWEHLARIQASPLLPPGLDFRPTTQAFDQIWYGMRTRGKADVDMFRDWYINITERLVKKAA